MKKLLVTALICLTAGVMLCGCSDRTEANKENFSDAINSSLVTKQALIPAPGIPSTVDRNMMVIKDIEALEENGESGISRDDVKLFRRQMSYAKLLQSTGLLKIDHGYYKQRNYRGEIVNTYGYKLRFNDKYAQDIVRTRDGKVSLSVGYIGVKDILSFSPPANKGGRIVSKVSYTRTVIGRPDWATDAVIEYSGIAAKMRGQMTAMVMQNPDGWEVMGQRQSNATLAASSIRKALRTGDLRTARRTVTTNARAR